MGRTRLTSISIGAAAAIAIGIAVVLWTDYGSSSDSGTPASNDSTNDTSNGTDFTGPPGNDNTNNASNKADFVVLPDADPPTVKDPGLRVEKVAEGLAQPTSMAFLDMVDLLVLEKDSGKIRFISDGVLQENPSLEVTVNTQNERGLLGIAVAGNSTSVKRPVFLYYTEQDTSGEVRNRVYRYEWSVDGVLTGGSLILDLPGTPGPNHDGGKLTIGAGNTLYAVIGDLNRNGMLQNYQSGDKPDDTSVILKVDFSGDPAGNVLSDDDNSVDDALSRYHAYGIRNSFGMDIDPLTGVLWDTENGPNAYDEINVVEPGFNSGWERVMGPIGRSGASEELLVEFTGSHYGDPAFSWRSSLGVTDIEFLNSAKLGEEYENNIFVGDFTNGNLYFFKVNENRDGLSFDSENPGLADLVADNRDEMEAVTFGSGFDAITDIETGPDGYLYVLSLRGDLYRIVPDV